MKTKNITQAIKLNASAEEVFDALMSSKKHSQFTGAKASMSQKIGGKFTAYDGYIEGVNIDLKPGKKIVQKWRAEDWEKDCWSEVVYDFSEKAGKTTLKFTQKGVPIDQYDSIKQGWVDYYWEPLKEMFGGK